MMDKIGKREEIKSVKFYCEYNGEKREKEIEKGDKRNNLKIRKPFHSIHFKRN